MLGDEVAVEVLQGHFGHGDPLLSVVTHGGARALAGHRHALAENTQSEVRTLDNTQWSVHLDCWAKQHKETAGWDNQGP